MRRAVRNVLVVVGMQRSATAGSVTQPVRAGVTATDRRCEHQPAQPEGVCRVPVGDGDVRAVDHQPRRAENQSTSARRQHPQDTITWHKESVVHLESEGIMGTLPPPPPPNIIVTAGGAKTDFGAGETRGGRL